MQKLNMPGGGAPTPHAPNESDVVDVITAIDNELVEWILHAHPKTEEDKAEMRQVLALRTSIDRQLNALVLQRMKLSTTNIQAEALHLGVITVRIRATAKSVATVKEVLSAAGEATSVIAQVVAAIL